MVYSFVPRGVCSRRMDIELEGTVIKNVTIYGGCSGNTRGISKLVEGREAQDIIDRVKGTRCGPRPTSCPDQLALALEAALKASAAE